MRIYIPTRSRPHFSTLDALPQTLRSSTVVVVRADEADMYEEVVFSKKGRNPWIAVLPKKVEGLAATRQWILKHGQGEVIAMLDDDITSFCTKDDLEKFGGVRAMSMRETIRMFEELYGVMDYYTCVSTVDRMALARPSKTEFNFPSRAGQSMFINRKVAMKRGYRFDRIAIYHDQDFALQIARDGRKCATSNRYGHNMRPLYAKGGLQTYRDQSLVDECANKLVKLHGDLVTLKWKERNGMNIPTRSINWKRAYESSSTWKRRRLSV